MDDEIGTRAIDTVTLELTREEAMLARNTLYASVDRTTASDDRMALLRLCERLWARLSAGKGGV